MAFEAILDEVTQLHSVSTRLERLAELHLPVSDALLRIAGKRAQHRHDIGSIGSYKVARLMAMLTSRAG
ncbi:MAG: hypothetical protein WCG81_00935 [Candidatus Angelobacter sp.]